MGEKVGLPYLEKLVGKTVTVFKGGPESRTGILLEVKKDYLVLELKGKNYVYYPFKQLKSVIDHSKNSVTVSKEHTEEDEKQPTFPDKFRDVVRHLQNSVVQVNGGGPASSKGFLMDVKSEFIVLSTEKEGLIFYRLDQVKSVTGVATTHGETESADSFEGDQSFADLLALHLYSWTTINGGPDKVEGVLVEVNKSYSVLVKHEDIIYVSNASIHFVAQQVSSDSNEEKNKEKSEQSSAGNSSEAKDKADKKSKKKMMISNLTRNMNVNQEE